MTGVQTCALPISACRSSPWADSIFRQVAFKVTLPVRVGPRRPLAKEMGFPIPRLLSAWDLFSFFLLLLRRSFLSSPIHHDPLGREERMNIGEIVENIQRQVSSSFLSLSNPKANLRQLVGGWVCARARLPRGEKDWCSTIIIQEGFLRPSLSFEG